MNPDFKDKRDEETNKPESDTNYQDDEEKKIIYDLFKGK